MEPKHKRVTFSMGSMLFEYDEKKDQDNRKKHGIPLKSAARVFFDYNRIELYDEENSIDEERYDVIGDIGVPITNEVAIGNIKGNGLESKDILFVVYTERIRMLDGEKEVEVTRLISARYATNFERGLYYGKHY